MRTLLSHAWVLTMDDEGTMFRDGYVLIDDGTILETGASSPSVDADLTVDCKGGILLPGFINLHCHAAMIPFRTMGDDCPDRLRRFLFPLENEALTPHLVYLAAKYACLEMLLAGITTFVDMYYFEDRVAEACLETGIRGYLGETVISQPSPSARTDQEGLSLTRQFIRSLSGEKMVHAIVAPHGTTTVSAEVLRSCSDLSQSYEIPLTLHAAEMDYEMASFAEKGTTPVMFLDGLTAVHPYLLAAHCIHLSQQDISVLAHKGASVAHCIGSNAKAGKGVSPVSDIFKAGVPFGFGTDGPSSGNTLSLFDQMRLFAVSQKTKYHDRSLFPAKDIVYAATRGGARCLHLENCAGQIAPGYHADLVLVSLDGPHMFPVYNPYSALVYAANASDVSMVITDGKIRVRDHCLTDFDLLKVRSDLYKAMGAFMHSAEQYRDII